MLLGKWGISIRIPVCHAATPLGDAAAGDQAGSVAPERFQGKGSPAFESERTPRLGHAHPQSARRLQVATEASSVVLPEARIDAHAPSKQSQTWPTSPMTRSTASTKA
jgi:hypothetical protein